MHAKQPTVSVSVRRDGDFRCAPPSGVPPAIPPEPMVTRRDRRRPPRPPPPPLAEGNGDPTCPCTVGPRWAGGLPHGRGTSVFSIFLFRPFLGSHHRHRRRGGGAGGVGQEIRIGRGAPFG
ncbi:hypothetical protein BHE74_00042458 [Ensete ventricosum]|nr:hypothetical protein BHE74_00042458 [Ensete ventricosum]